MDALPEVCQYLGNEHVRETDVDVLNIHLETLFLLSTRGGGEGKRLVKEMGTYPVVRELHLEVEDEGVRRGCERLVDVIMGDEGGHEKEHVSGGNGGVTENGNENRGDGRMITQAVDEDEEEDDDQIMPIF